MICVDDTRCQTCGTCAGVCAVNALIIEGGRITVDPEICVICLACIAVCPVKALKDCVNIGKGTNVIKEF